MKRGGGGRGKMGKGEIGEGSRCDCACRLKIADCIRSNGPPYMGVIVCVLEYVCLCLCVCVLIRGYL